VKAAFLVNARAATVVPGYLRDSRSSGYLYPPDAATREVTKSIAALSRTFVLADNGAFDNIGRIAREVSSVAGDNRWVRRLEAVRRAAEAVDTLGQFDQQLQSRPDAVVGPEDITLAAWLRASVPEGLLRRHRREIRRRNEEVASWGVALQARRPDLTILTVASAHDYDTAQDAGEVFRAAGIANAAMGFGAYMADDTWDASVKVQGRVRRLSRSLPIRYIRTALVSRGFFSGWGGHPALERFHFLGLGAPIMIPVVALPAGNCRHLSFDATSPIKDAAEGTLYVDQPAPLKVRLWKVADRMLRNQTAAWDCPCPFCGAYTDQNPLDMDRARAIVAGRIGPLVATDLRSGTPLANALPLFALGTGVARKAEQARIGHNHWILGRLTSSLSRHTASLDRFAEGCVARYEAHAGAQHFSDAVRTALEIARPDGDFWR
jgi:hypothetical protein